MMHPDHSRILTAALDAIDEAPNWLKRAVANAIRAKSAEIVAEQMKEAAKCTFSTSR